MDASLLSGRKPKLSSPSYCTVIGLRQCTHVLIWSLSERMQCSLPAQLYWWLRIKEDQQKTQPEEFGDLWEPRTVVIAGKSNRPASRLVSLSIWPKPEKTTKSSGCDEFCMSSWMVMQFHTLQHTDSLLRIMCGKKEGGVQRCWTHHPISWKAEARPIILGNGSSVTQEMMTLP